MLSPVAVPKALKAVPVTDCRNTIIIPLWYAAHSMRIGTRQFTKWSSPITPITHASCRVPSGTALRAEMSLKLKGS